MSTAAERLGQFLEYLSIKVSPFEKKIEAGNATIRKILEENREISGDIVNKILAKYPDLNRNWLLFGEGEMIVKSVDNSLKSEKGVPIEKFLEVANELRELNKDLNQRLKNEIAYEQEISALRLKIQELEFRLKQG